MLYSIHMKEKKSCTIFNIFT